jgi:putative exosortase-associated protein (TIGR04073 family)
MTTFHRFFVSFLFISLLMAYTPLTQADHQQQSYGGNQVGGNMTYTSATQADKPQQRSYGSKIGKKALSGWTNLSLGILEIPKNIINTTNQSNIIYGAIGGLFKGLINTAGRMAVGITDLITFPLPTKPIARPLFIWDDFDVDTTYGEVFRLDRTPEIKEPIIEEPIAQPAAQPVAPVVVAPQEPVDLDKNQQEINRKLDSLFKKEMMK